MAQPHKTLSPTSRLSLVMFTVLFAFFGAACDDFYTDSLPTPQIAQPTPISLQANGQNARPEELVEAGARTALAATLGIDLEAPRKILLDDATWTDRNPGCYPRPAGVSGPYLVPGYRLLMQYEGVFYEYDADLGGQTGALCDSTMQRVPVEPALDIVTANMAGSTRPDAGAVYVLRSEDDVSAFNSTNSGIASVAVGVVDWTTEVLVGGWVITTPNSEAVRAYRSPAEPSQNAGNGSTGTHVIIEVAVPDDRPEDQLDDGGSTGLVQIWALVDITGPVTTYEFAVPE